MVGMSPTCQHHATIPWPQMGTALPAAHMWGGEQTSPPSAAVGRRTTPIICCCGEENSSPSSAAGKNQPVRSPGKPAKLWAPAPSAGCKCAYVRSQESWRGLKGVNSFKIVLDAWCISIYTMCFTFLPTGFSWCSVCRRRPCCEF